MKGEAFELTTISFDSEYKFEELPLGSIFCLPILLDDLKWGN